MKDSRENLPAPGATPVKEKAGAGGDTLAAIILGFGSES